MKLFILVFAIGLTACGSDDSEPSKPLSLPTCCAGKTASDFNQVLMCKALTEEPNSEISSIYVERTATGMISTLEEMKFLTCQ